MIHNGGDNGCQGQWLIMIHGDYYTNGSCWSWFFLVYSRHIIHEARGFPDGFPPCPEHQLHLATLQIRITRKTRTSGVAAPKAVRGRSQDSLGGALPWNCPCDWCAVLRHVETNMTWEHFATDVGIQYVIWPKTVTKSRSTHCDTEAPKLLIVLTLCTMLWGVVPESFQRRDCPTSRTMRIIRKERMDLVAWPRCNTDDLPRKGGKSLLVSRNDCS